MNGQGDVTTPRPIALEYENLDAVNATPQTVPEADDDVDNLLPEEFLWQVANDPMTPPPPGMAAEWTKLYAPGDGTPSTESASPAHQ